MTPVQTLSAALEKINKNWAETFGGQYAGGIYSSFLKGSEQMPPIGDRRAGAADLLIMRLQELLAAIKDGDHGPHLCVEFTALSAYLPYFLQSDALLDLSLGEDD